MATVARPHPAGAPGSRRRPPRARGRGAGRPSGGSAAHAPLDLEDLLLLGRADAIDLGDVAVGGLLEVVHQATLLVDADLAVLLELLELVRTLATEVADL